VEVVGNVETTSVCRDGNMLDNGEDSSVGSLMASFSTGVDFFLLHVQRGDVTEGNWQDSLDSCLGNSMVQKQLYVSKTCIFVLGSRQTAGYSSAWQQYV
jgi:hypothetical protein